MGNQLGVRVIGNVELRRDGVAQVVGGPKPRLLLAILVAARGGVVSVDRLADELWGDDQPAKPGAVLQSNVSRLRRLLEPDARIVARAPGYALEVGDELVDAWCFENRCDAARSAKDPSQSLAMYQEALADSGGPAFGEFADRDWARADVARLEEMRTVAREEALSMRLDLGEDRSIVAELEALVAEHPLRERPWVVLAMALHRSGRSADALRRVTTFRSILRDELGLDPPLSILALEGRILESDPALLSSPPLAGRRSRLPPSEVTSLVGRSTDIAGIVARIAADRLVTLVGPGGVGKTRLAMRVAADTWDSCGGEVYVVELAPVQDAASTVASVATAIDVQQRQGLSLEDTLIEFLHGRRVLLVLDNCEHLRLSVARLIERLLAACPDLTVLATSREVIGLASEHVWRVEPLAVAEGGWSDGLAAVPAVRLFIDRAVASNPAFVLDRENASAIAEIVRRVEGLPLAIELAAARLRAISPAALAERLGQRFDLLDDAQFANTDRHRTVADLVGWSFNLLSLDEQRLFGRLSAFAGAFGLEAVESICTDETFDAAMAVRVLAPLVDKSMVQMIDRHLGRYRVLEPLREFGLAQLDPAAAAALSERHAIWCLDLAEQAGAALGGEEEAAAVARVDRDFDNIRAAFSWIVDHRDVDRASRVVVALHEYSFRAMRAEVIAWADDVIAMTDFADSANAPIVLGIAAYGRFVRGDLESAIQQGRLALQAAERLSVGTGGLAERALGNALFFQGDADVAQEWIDKMLDLAREGPAARLAHGLYMRSVAYTSVGHTQRGVELADEALVCARRCGSPTALAQASYALGLALESSDETAAAALLAQAAEVASSAGNRWIQAFALTEVLWLEARRGAPRSALGGFADVIDLWFRGGDWTSQWLSLRHVFGILVQLEDYRAAATLHGALTAVGAAYALPFEASDAERITRLVGLLRERLGTPAFTSAVRRGASMRDGEIVEFIQERIAVVAVTPGGSPRRLRST